MSEKNRPLIPKVSRVFRTAASTNALAVAAAGHVPPPVEGTVFQAIAQTAGRGQGRNSWHASPGRNLTCSLLTYPAWLPLDRLFLLNQITALAVARTVDDLGGGPASVKWPNDVFAADRKIAGILIQNGLRGNRLAWSVIGVGLNVNETDFPGDLRQSATSLRLRTGQDIAVNTARDGLLDHFADSYNKVMAGDRETVDREYHARLYRKGEPTEFLHIASGRRFRGIIRGVNRQGQLRVRVPPGRESRFDLREIRMLADGAG